MTPLERFQSSPEGRIERLIHDIVVSIQELSQTDPALLAHELSDLRLACSSLGRTIEKASVAELQAAE